MKILILESERYAQAASGLIMEHILNDPSGVVGFATGTTTPPVHEALVRRFGETKTAASRLAVFNVDEYLGISPDDPRTCLSRMKSQLYEQIRPKELICFRSDAPDPEEDARRVLREINGAGGLRLQILGIGKDGHIGFNDPGTPWEFENVVVSFSPSSQLGKADFWGGVENVPKRGATLGIKGIMNARSLMLLAKGESKAEIIHAALEGPVTLNVPASVLQLHPAATVVLDRSAASRLQQPRDF
ncbi:MAG: glucosamine-6-phosphate deaminase [Synergistaceae bacterium]|jgi:glucosamine-6-phosphate deaminase|nr:glucosamine-6-phosphate deaminase [Synergistaceae bacterium]